jgi:cold-inducible RNA-binding protein
LFSDWFRASFNITRTDIEMATKLYVGNLPFQTTSDDLREHFAQAGNVESAQVVEDRMTGRSRGFGFVEMTTAEEAAAAIEQFNGKDFNGRNLTVNEARPRTDRAGGGYGGGGGGNRGGYGGGGGGGFGGGGGGGGRRDRDRGERRPSRNDREPRW